MTSNNFTQDFFDAVMSGEREIPRTKRMELRGELHPHQWINKTIHPGNLSRGASSITLDAETNRLHKAKCAKRKAQKKARKQSRNKK